MWRSRHFRPRSAAPSVLAMTTSQTPAPAGAAAATAGTGAGTGLAITSVVSVQFGAAGAAHLFGRIGPLATVSLRLMAAGLVLALLTRPWRRSWTRVQLRAAVGFGTVFTAMNCLLYLALDRLPLATVITLEFLGPLTVAMVSAGGVAVRLWALPAAGGVELLGGSLSAHDLLGVLFALGAACCWAGYIILSGRVGRVGTGLPGLAVGCVFGAVIMLPVGVATAGTALLSPGVLALGALVGVASSAIPYSLDLLALRRLPTAVFGVLTSLNPGVAAIAGFVVLGQALSPRSLVGVVLVMIASAGVTLMPIIRRRVPRRRPGTDRSPRASRW